MQSHVQWSAPELRPLLPWSWRWGGLWPAAHRWNWRHTADHQSGTTGGTNRFTYFPSRLNQETTGTRNTSGSGSGSGLPSGFARRSGHCDKTSYVPPRFGEASILRNIVRINHCFQIDEDFCHDTKRLWGKLAVLSQQNTRYFFEYLRLTFATVSSFSFLSATETLEDIDRDVNSEKPDTDRK